MPLVSTLSLAIQENLDFINLTNRKFAEYNIIYHVNDGFKINELKDFKHKEQLLFQKFESQNQQLNLMLVDSVFPIILADLALLALLGKIKSFDCYINSHDRITFPRIVDDKAFFESKMKSFINGLIYGEVSGLESWNGETNNQRVFCRKNSIGELEYYSIYDRKKLLDLLIKKINIEVSEFKWITNDKSEVIIKLSFKI